jgi:hypothetical protein
MVPKQLEIVSRKLMREFSKDFRQKGPVSDQGRETDNL